VQFPGVRKRGSASDRLPDGPFADYGLADDDVREVGLLQEWPRDPKQDPDGHRVHAEVHQ
jgi:hypothetical protein